MVDKRQPTNADLLREFKRMGDTIGTMDTRLSIVEGRWRAHDIAKEAVAEYKKQESEEGRGKSSNTINQQLVKAVLAALSIISALVATWAATT